MSKNRVAVLSKNQYNLPHQKEINMDTTFRMTPNETLEDSSIINSSNGQFNTSKPM